MRTQTRPQGTWEAWPGDFYGSGHHDGAQDEGPLTCRCSNRGVCDPLKPESASVFRWLHWSWMQAGLPARELRRPRHVLDRRARWLPSNQLYNPSLCKRTSKTVIEWTVKSTFPTRALQTTTLKLGLIHQ